MKRERDADIAARLTFPDIGQLGPGNTSSPVVPDDERF